MARSFVLWTCATTLCCAQGEQHATLDEVLVTAQRREQRAQDVPTSISVLPGEQLERRQIDDIDALQFAVPNLVVAPNMTSRSAAAIAMRGQFERDASPTVDPAVGLYLDGVYIARTTGANLRMFDVARVEVMRGPQGTLFGRNTVGGAINVVPRLPTPELEASASAALGNYDRRELSGLINAPLDQAAAFRLTAAHTEHRGYATSTVSGREIAGDDTNYVRAQLRIAPRERWDLNLAADYTHTRAGSQWMTLASIFPPAAGIPASQGNSADEMSYYVRPYTDDVPVNRAGGSETDTWGTSATLTANLPLATFKSITAYRELSIDAAGSDQDGTPYDVAAIVTRHDAQEQFSQELQAYGAALGERLEWIGGLYYFEEHALFTQEFPLLAPGSFDPVEAIPWGAVKNDTLAAYAQLTYELLPRMRLTLGGRYNRDSRQLTSRNSLRRRGVQTCRLDPALLDAPNACQATLPEQEFEYIPFNFVVDFEPHESTLLYAKLSRSHRAGGYNLRGAALGGSDSFGPEEVTAYELGTKTDLFEHRLRINLALYRSLFDDMQLQVLPPAEPGVPFSIAVIRNSGEARIQGGELEISAVAGPLNVSAALGITDARYTKLDPAAIDIRPGSRFLMTPRTTAALSLDFPTRVRFGELGFHADYAWRDEISFSFEPDSPARQGAYGLLNALVSARLDTFDVEVSLWGRNLTDTRYFTRAFQNVFLVAGVPGDPRTYGITFSYRFGGQ